MWIVGKNRDITSGYHLFIGEGNTLEGWALGDKNSSNSVFKLPDDSKWAHCVFTYNQNKGGSLYYNGNKVADSPAVGPVICNNETEGFSIGRLTTFNLYHFQGKIDEVRIYGRALSEVEVFELYRHADDLPERGAPVVGAPEDVPGGLVNYIALLVEVRKEIVAAESELLALLEEGRKKESEVKELKGKLKSLEEELAELNRKLKACEESGGLKRAELSELENRILSKEMELIAVKGELSGVRKSLKDADCEVEKVEERMEYLKKEMKESDGKLKTAHTPGWHYAPGYGWLWTSPKHYPQIYSNSRQGWVYYEQGTSEPWLYYDYGTQQWEEWFVDGTLFSSSN